MVAPLVAEETSTDARQKAIVAGLKLVQKAADSYPKQRKCFSCHHQTMPIMAMVEARRAGFKIDEAVLKATTEFALRSFSSRHERLNSGKGIGGRAMTVSYGLWTLDLVKHPHDETTQAMVEFLLKSQIEDGHWSRNSNRPPLQESEITSTVMSVHFMQKYADESQKPRVAESVAKAKKWLFAAKINSQEDRNSQLSALLMLRGEKEKVAAVKAAILKAQRADGGWGQIDSMESDAYATGQTLWTLRHMGTKSDDEEFRRGVAFLLKTQQDDGSWFVKTRAKPVQVFFDNGDPHGKSQFISTAATAWAIAALAMDRETERDKKK